MRISLVTFILILLFYGCKRYEENSAITFRTINNRLQGNYSIEIETVNGQTVAPFISDTNFWSINPSISNYTFSVLSKKEKKTLIQESGEPSSLLNKSGEFKIEFIGGGSMDEFFLLSDDESEISFYASQKSAAAYGIINDTTFISNIPGYLGMLIQYEDEFYLTDTWQISKLTNTEFWLQTNFNGHEYDVHFKKI